MADRSIVPSKLNDLRKLRAQEIKKRKNFFPSLIITLALWFLITITILFVDPTQRWALEIFFVLLFLSLLFTFSLLLINTRRGFIVSIAITLFAGLLYLGVGNLLNLLLVVGASSMFEIYFTKRK